MAPTAAIFETLLLNLDKQFIKAKEHNIPLKVIHITDKAAAQSLPAPVTTYALFRDGEFLTQAIQSDKKFLALSGVKL